MSPSPARPAAARNHSAAAASMRTTSPRQSQNENQRPSSISSIFTTSPTSTSTPPPHPPKPRAARNKPSKRPLCKPRRPLADPRTACSVRAHVPTGVLAEAEGLSYGGEDDDEGEQEHEQEDDEFEVEADAAAPTTTATTAAFPRKDWSRAMPKDFDNSAAPSLFLDAAYAARRFEALKAMRGKRVAGP